MREARNEFKAQDEGRRKIKRLKAVSSPVFWFFPLSLHERCAPIAWLINDALFWHVCLEQDNVTHSCSFDDAVRKAFRLLPTVPEIKENQKKCLNLLLKSKDVLGLLPTAGLEKT